MLGQWENAIQSRSLGVSMLLAYMLAGLANGAPMQPTGQWIVEFADNACVLSRRFGDRDNPINVHFKAAMIGDSFEMVIVTPEKSPSDEVVEEGWIERPDGSKIQPVQTNSYSSVAKTRLTRVPLDPERYVLGSDGERLILHVSRKRKYDLALPNLGKALKVVDDCSKGLRKDHGIDDQALSRVVISPKSREPLYKYFSTNDYPDISVRAGEQGNVGVLYWAEADGRVRECKVIETSHFAALDAQTCLIVVSRSRYSPALDAVGQPVRSPLYQRIKWRMPSE